MELGRILIVLILCFFYDIRNCGAVITPVDKTYIAILGEDLKIRWEFENESSVFNVEWSFQNKTASSPIAVMVKILTNPIQVVETGFNIEHDSNGNVTITEVTSDNEGIYYCTVAYTGAIYPTVTGTATVKIEATTDVISTSTSTTTPTTSTTIPTTTTTIPTTTTTIPTTTTTIPTTTTTIPTTTTSISTRTTSPSIPTSTTTTKSADSSSSTSLTTSSSNESTVIIVSSVLGGLFLIGIVITIVLMLLSHRRGHHPARNHRHRDQDRRHKRRDHHRYPSWQDHRQNNNTSYIEYPGMGTKMKPLYVPYRSAHRGEQNYYLGHPSSDHQSYPRNDQIYYGGHYNNVRPHTNMHSYQQRYYGGKGGYNISNSLARDGNNYVAPDYELY